MQVLLNQQFTGHIEQHENKELVTHITPINIGHLQS